MKLPKVLAINGVSIGLTKEDVRLDAANPGRANFTVQSVEALKGRVTLDVGYNDRTLQRRFIGYVERCTAANAVLRVLFCRELAAVLTNSQPLNLRHVNLRTVLAQVREQAGLRFHVPDRPYASMKAPYFYSLVAACQATDSLARVFSIPDFTWYPLGNGKVFVGRWGDSFDGVAALAGLRSGATINHGERITRVTSMTRWPSDGRCNRRAGERQFPELTGGYLLSRFARIVAVAGAPADAGICGDVRPRYAVDFVVLGADDEPDPALLPLTGVALPLPTGGEKMGFYAFPAEGTRVVCASPTACRTHSAFKRACPGYPKVISWGSTAKPPSGVSMPMATGCVRPMANPRQGNRREVEVLDNTQSVQHHTRTVADPSTESVQASKRSRHWARSSGCRGDRSAWRRWTICTRSPDGI